MVEEWFEIFKKGYDKGETWKDAEDLLNSLSEEQLTHFITVHEDIEKLTGLDMRQEFYLRSAKVTLKFKKEA